MNQKKMLYVIVFKKLGKRLLPGRKADALRRPPGGSSPPSAHPGAQRVAHQIALNSAAFGC